MKSLSTEQLLKITTLGELKKSGYTSLPIKEELRKNLIAKLQKRERLFEAIQAYDETVIPELERALLSRHNILLLGLRGQAKTRIARLMTQLLDEYVPYVLSSEIHDDPLRPITQETHRLIEEHGDKLPIGWLHRNERYAEKLATPDVSVADLIGDVDPIKAANMRLSYSDERVIHFGLIPRSHRCIFVINELPDLQARIQVSLFNILQEGDIQIRGFKLRLPLDIQFVFTANPEDYTNRGSIVTPLKDRIESQILTHYPKDVATARQITEQEAKISDPQRSAVQVPSLLMDILEQIAFEARSSEFIDQKSGVSARLSISGLENLYSTAERRMILNNETSTVARISDLYGVIPSITGKIELVYEGEQEGTQSVAHHLIDRAIRSVFAEQFGNPEKLKRKKEGSPFAEIQEWFASGNELNLMMDESDAQRKKFISSVVGLESLIKRKFPKATGEDKLFLMEMVLHGLAAFSLLTKQGVANNFQFKDMFSSVISGAIRPEEQ
jgi:magnesium chelatase subunit I